MSRHPLPQNPKQLRVGSRLGKYKLTRRLGQGGFARVYAAFDTIEQRHVALKIPAIPDRERLDDALREVRVLGRLEHPNILGLRAADFVDGHLVLTFPLGDGTLEDRMRRRIGRKKALRFAQQLLEGLAHAHAARVTRWEAKAAGLPSFARAASNSSGGTSVALRR